MVSLNKKKHNKNFFENFTPHERAEVTKYFEREELIPKGTVIIEGGRRARALFRILKGRAEVVQGDHKISQLHEGECFGYTALLKGEVSTTTVVAKTEMVVSLLDEEGLEKMRHDNLSLHDKLILTLSHSLYTHLNKTNHMAVKSLKKQLDHEKEREASAIIFSYILFLVSLWAILGGFLNYLLKNDVKQTLWVTTPTLIVTALCTFVGIWHSGKPLSFFGITTRNFTRNAIEGVICSILMLLVILLFKYLLRLWGWISHKEPLIVPGFYPLEFIYILVIPLQELIARGGMLGPLYHALPQTKMRATIAVVVSTFGFASVHAFLSTGFVLGVIPPSLVWGYLYLRQKSLVGVIVSHILVGYFALAWFNLNDILIDASF